MSMVSDDTDFHASASGTAEQLGDGFSPPAADQQRPLGEPDVLAIAQAEDDRPTLGSQSAF
ncbi:MAG: hypothetical protein V4864_03005 [Pseudomonadota bacterium]